jgi:hypothetical protein
MGKIATLVLIAGLLVGGWYYIQSLEFNLFGLSFGGELKIEKTANVVEKIKEISEFTTACYYEEAVLKDNKVEKNEGGFLGLIDMETSKEIVIIAKGKVRVATPEKYGTPGEIYQSQSFIDMANGKTDNFTSTIDDGLEAQLVIDAVIRADREKRYVTVEEIRRELK